MSDQDPPQLGAEIDPPRPPHALLPLLPSPILQETTPSVPAPYVASIEGWVCSTHLFPAAFPRSHPLSTSPPVPSPIEASDERAQRKLDMATFDAAQLQPESFYPAATEEAALEQAQKLAARKEEKPLWGVVQRWTNKEAAKNKDAIVIVAGHANGFHKEAYEPVFEALLRSTKAPIAELWSLDTSDSGYAGFLNRGKLGWAAPWFDLGRDMLSLLAHLPAPGEEIADLLESPASLDYATAAPPVGGRRIFGIGHSASAQGWLWASYTRPTAVAGILILDGVLPSIDMAGDFLPARALPIARGAVARKEVFESREAVSTYVHTKPFFKAWHPRSLELYIQHGFHPLHPGSDSKAVTLAMPKYREAAMFGNTWLAGFAVSAALTRRFKGRIQTIRMSDSPIPVADAEVYEAFGAEVVEMEGGHLIVQNSLSCSLSILQDSWKDGSHLRVRSAGRDSDIVD